MIEALVTVAQTCRRANIGNLRKEKEIVVTITHR